MSPNNSKTRSCRLICAKLDLSKKVIIPKPIGIINNGSFNVLQSNPQMHTTHPVQPRGVEYKKLQIYNLVVITDDDCHRSGQFVYLSSNTTYNTCSRCLLVQLLYSVFKIHRHFHYFPSISISFSNLFRNSFVFFFLFKILIIVLFLVWICFCLAFVPFLMKNIKLKVNVQTHTHTEFWNFHARRISLSDKNRSQNISDWLTVKTNDAARADNIKIRCENNIAHIHTRTHSQANKSAVVAVQRNIEHRCLSTIAVIVSFFLQLFLLIFVMFSCSAVSNSLNSFPIELPSISLSRVICKSTLWPFTRWLMNPLQSDFVSRRHFLYVLLVPPFINWWRKVLIQYFDKYLKIGLKFRNLSK